MSEPRAPPGPLEEPKTPLGQTKVNAFEGFLRRRWRAIVIDVVAFAVVAFAIGWAFGAFGRSDSKKSASESEPPRPQPPAKTAQAPPPPAVTPNPGARLVESQCDYLRGDVSGNNHRFVARTAIKNTGNIGLVVRVTATWNQLGGAPVKMVKTVKVWPGSRSIQFSTHATSDQIDAHQAADAKCAVKAKIVDTFGQPQ